MSLALTLRACAVALLLAVTAAAAAQTPAASASSAPIPFKRDASPAAQAGTTGALGVLALSALAIGVVFWVRKRLRFSNGGALEGARHVRVLETTRLGPKSLLSVVEFGGKRYLIAQSEHGVSCLASEPGGAGEQA